MEVAITGQTCAVAPGSASSLVDCEDFLTGTAATGVEGAEISSTKLDIGKHHFRGLILMMRPGDGFILGGVSFLK